MSFNYLKSEKDKTTQTTQINHKNITNAINALYNSYNLHLYKIDYFMENIVKILCFDADLAEDTGNGRNYPDRNKNNKNDYDMQTHFTIYGEMNTHYIAPIIQIFNYENKCILAIR